MLFNDMRMLGQDDGFETITRWRYHKSGFDDLVMERTCLWWTA